MNGTIRTRFNLSEVTTDSEGVARSYLTLVGALNQRVFSLILSLQSELALSFVDTHLQEANDPDYQHPEQDVNRCKELDQRH